MKKFEFDAVICKHENLDAGYIEFPFDVLREFGKKGQVKVKAFFDGFEYWGSLVKMGFACHIIGLNKKVREAIHKQPGDTVHVVIVEDFDERKVEIPDDLNAVINGDQEIKSRFEKLSFSNKREYVVWITSSRKTETRLARIEKFGGMILAGQKNPN